MKMRPLLATLDFLVASSLAGVNEQARLSRA